MSPSNWLNNTTAVLLQRWLWPDITHEGWYACKQRKLSQTLQMSPSNWLNNTTVLLQGWLWPDITHEGWYACKQRKLRSQPFQMSPSNWLNNTTAVLYSNKVISFIFFYSSKLILTLIYRQEKRFYESFKNIFKTIVIYERERGRKRTCMQ